MNDIKATVSAEFNAPIAKVWTALTDPKEIKKYLFGTNAISDWTEGSPIVFEGEWQGKTYQDKGTILKIEPEKVLKYTYRSQSSELPDVPENYSILTFELKPATNGTELAITQEKAASQEALDHSMKNWTMVLDSMKKQLEE